MSDAGPGEGQQVKAQEGCSGLDALDYERARDRVQELKGFYAHAAVFLFANIVLVVLNLATLRKNDGILWFIWPLIGWALCLLSMRCPCLESAVSWAGSGSSGASSRNLTGVTAAEGGTSSARRSERYR